MVDEAAQWFVRWALGGSLLATMLLFHCRLRDRAGSDLPLLELRAAIVASVAMPAVALAPLLAVNFSKAPMGGIVSSISGSAMAQLFIASFLGLAAVGFAGRLLGLARQHRKLQCTFANANEIEIANAGIVSIRVSDDIGSPIVFGAFAPRILLPKSFPTWSVREQMATLDHELTHVKRRDLLWLMAGHIVGALYFWSPPVQRLLNYHRISMEEACDLETTSQRLSRKAYASSLIALARRSSVSPDGPALGVMHSSLLERRIRLLLINDRPPRGRFGNFFSIPVFAIALSASSVCPGHSIHRSSYPSPSVATSVGALESTRRAFRSMPGHRMQARVSFSQEAT